MTATQPTQPQHRRPTLWIALTVVFALAALALGLWAVSLNSDLDSANAELASTRAELAEQTQQAEQGGLAGGAVSAAVTTGVAALQDQLGLTPAQVDAAQQQLTDAKQRADQAAQDLANAGSDAAAKARAEAEAASAKGTMAVACARAAVGVLTGLSSGTGDLRTRLSAATDALGALGPQCKPVFAS